MRPIAWNSDALYPESPQKKRRASGASGAHTRTAYEFHSVVFVSSGVRALQWLAGTAARRTVRSTASTPDAVCTATRHASSVSSHQLSSVIRSRGTPRRTSSGATPFGTIHRARREMCGTTLRSRWSKWLCQQRATYLCDTSTTSTLRMSWMVHGIGRMRVGLSTLSSGCLPNTGSVKIERPCS